MNILLEQDNTSNSAYLSNLFADTPEPLSDWLDVRITEMSGFDYVFVPMAICDQITDFITLQEFLLNVQAVLGSEPQRTILIGFQYSKSHKLELDRYDVSWSDTLVVDCSRTSLNGAAQFEFVELLFEYSENLISEEA